MANPRTRAAARTAARTAPGGIRSGLRAAALLLLAGTALGGCSGAFDDFTGGFRSFGGGPRGGLAARPSGPRADVNSNRRLGDIDIPIVDTPTLQQMIDRTPVRKDDGKESPADKLRMPAMRDAALSYGARGGLAWTSRGINEMLKTRAAELSKTYDFNRVLIRTPTQATILPPVISEAREAYETSDAGKTLRVADTVYEIVDQARFAPVAPLWHTYLVRSYSAPEPPPDTLLPKTDGERDAWKKWIAEGWEMGNKQAQEIFQADMRRLERDFVGMIRYKTLLDEGKVSAPVVAAAELGVTGTGQDMRVNDRALRITRDPTLQTPTAGWTAPPSPVTTDQAAQDRPTAQVEPGPADNTRARTGNGWRRY